MGDGRGGREGRGERGGRRGYEKLLLYPCLSLTPTSLLHSSTVIPHNQPTPPSPSPSLLICSWFGFLFFFTLSHPLFFLFLLPLMPRDNLVGRIIEAAKEKKQGGGGGGEPVVRFTKEGKQTRGHERRKRRGKTRETNDKSPKQSCVVKASLFFSLSPKVFQKKIERELEKK